MSHIQLNRQPPRMPRVLFGQTVYVKGKTPRFSGVYLGLLDESSMELVQSRKLKELTLEMQEALSRRGISYGSRHANPPGRRPCVDRAVRLGLLAGAGHEEVGVARVLQHLSDASGPKIFRVIFIAICTMAAAVFPSVSHPCAWNSL